MSHRDDNPMFSTHQAKCNGISCHLCKSSQYAQQYWSCHATAALEKENRAIEARLAAELQFASQDDILAAACKSLDVIAVGKAELAVNEAQCYLKAAETEQSRVDRQPVAWMQLSSLFGDQEVKHGAPKPVVYDKTHTERIPGFVAHALRAFGLDRALAPANVTVRVGLYSDAHTDLATLLASGKTPETPVDLLLFWSSDQTTAAHGLAQYEAWKDQSRIPPELKLPCAALNITELAARLYIHGYKRFGPGFALCSRPQMDPISGTMFLLDNLVSLGEHTLLSADQVIQCIIKHD